MSIPLDARNPRRLPSSVSPVRTQFSIVRLCSSSPQSDACDALIDPEETWIDSGYVPVSAAMEAACRGGSGAEASANTVSRTSRRPIQMTHRRPSQVARVEEPFPTSSIPGASMGRRRSGTHSSADAGSLRYPPERGRWVIIES